MTGGPGFSAAPRCPESPLTGGQPKNFLRPCALLLLDEEPAYGYELRVRLRNFAIPCDAGTIYRVLNTMEEEGLVSSEWERSASGPQRRRYRPTEEGRAVLSGWAQELSSMAELINGFLARYERDLEAHDAMLVGTQHAAEPRPDEVQISGVVAELPEAVLPTP